MTVGAVYKFLLSVDARSSGGYLDGAKRRMRAHIYELARGAFAAAGVGQAMLHMEDRGDGFIAAVDARVPPVQLLGTWLTEVHERQRRENEHLARPLGLRIGMHVGPVEHDDEGLSGVAMDLVCRLADSQTVKDVLARSGRDLVCVVSDSLYHEVVRHGGRFVEPSTYRAAQVSLKEGPTTAWFHVPGTAGLEAPGSWGGRAGEEAEVTPRRVGGIPEGPRGGVPAGTGLGKEGTWAAPDQEERDGAPSATPGGGEGPGARAKAASSHPDPPAPPGREPVRPAGEEWLDGEWPAGDGGEGAHVDVRDTRGDVFTLDRAVFNAPATFGGHRETPRRGEDR
jgi:hypothetical protein